MFPLSALVNERPAHVLYPSTGHHQAGLRSENSSGDRCRTKQTSFRRLSKALFAAATRTGAEKDGLGVAALQWAENGKEAYNTANAQTHETAVSASSCHVLGMDRPKPAAQLY